MTSPNYGHPIVLPSLAGPEAKVRKRIRVGILGSGNIGCDLAERLLKDDRFEVSVMVGRRQTSPGLQSFEKRIPFLFAGGSMDVSKAARMVEVIFDATSAADHPGHSQAAFECRTPIIDLTPARVGTAVVPALMEDYPWMRKAVAEGRNVSMVTCGGQSSAPIVHVLVSNCTDVQSIEVSTSIAAKSAGPATRRNVDDYVQATELLTSRLSGCLNTKAILVLNPLVPPVMMRTTVNVEADNIDLAGASATLAQILPRVVRYVPGYRITITPHLTSPNVITATVRVAGEGHYLPSYAGNLDIINAAAVETAFNIVSVRNGVSSYA